MKKIWLIIAAVVVAIAVAAGVLFAVLSGDDNSGDNAPDSDVSGGGNDNQGGGNDNQGGGNSQDHQHTVVVDASVEPTCDKTGLTEGKHCSECNAVIVPQTTVPMKDHTEGEWIIDKQPTASENGKRHQVCSVCQNTIREEDIPMTGGLEYVINSDGSTCTVTGIGTYSGKELYIPEYIDGYKVTDIGEYAFMNCTDLTGLVIADGVKRINEGAFAACTGIVSITIPGSVEMIGDLAFYTCESLEAIVIPNGVKTIGGYAFEACSAAKSLYISESVIGIHVDAFFACGAFESITVASGNSVYHSANNCLIETQEKRLLLGTKNSTIPEDGSVKSIRDYAFYVCEGLNSIVIPASVEKVDTMSFYACDSLISIVVASGNKTYHSVDNCLIETASGTLVLGCKNSIIPKDGSVKSIGSCAFNGCSIKNLFIPKSVTSIGWAAFDSCKAIESITVEAGNSVYKGVGNCLIDVENKTLILGCNNSVIPADGSVKKIDASAFYNCTELKSIVIPNGVTEIGDYAFWNCTNLEQISIPDSVTAIGGFAFAGCTKLKAIAIPEKLTYIREGLFAYCENLSTVVIPEGPLMIIDGAFAYCTGLKDIVIPESIMAIGASVFEGCDALVNVYYGGTAERWNSVAVGELNDALATATLYFYSATQPASAGNFWHFVAGMPTKW